MRLGREPDFVLRGASSVFRRITAFLLALRDFAFPPVCVGCNEQETGGGLVCESCLARLEQHALPIAATGRDALSHVRSLGPYAPPFSTLVHELKYRNRRSLAAVLGESLAGLLMSDGVLRGADVLAPIPLHPARLRERGYNQSQLLAEQVARPTRRDWADVLRRVKNTRAQVKIEDSDARRKNLEGAFALRPGTSVVDRKVILIDDVSTTGATLDSAAKTLQAAGAFRVYALVVARAKT
jgi:ComF family protein